ncbi:hypothetical protein DFS33DRAFT_477646 [Desarmillaria ectypa]|nr:hypothetical protein DFS33DRAFT_477646 [Desarmillaria ectypa]
MRVLSDVLHSLGSLRRRTSLRESIRSTASTHSSLKGKGKHSRSSSYHPNVTKKLLEAILDTPGGRRSLSRLARTCKAMREPALNVLWRELDSLIPILGLFPSSLLKKTRRPGLGLAKNPTEDDWSKILKYGERVRRIAYNEAINNVAASIFPIFEQYRPRTFILPNLQQLVWKIESPAGLERCSLFLNPELESISLEIGTRFPELNHFLADMSSRTKLKEFSFISPTPLPDAFTELLLPQKSLCKVVLVAPGALSPGVGRWLASLEELKVLELDLSGRGVVAVEGFFEELSPRSGYSTPSSVMTTDSGVFSGEELDFSDHRKSALRLTGDLRSKGSFATIRQLQLTGEVSNIAVFLRHLRSTLIQLELIIEDPPDIADWQDLSALISERFGTTLQSLRISGSGSSRYSELVRSTARAEPPKRLPLGYFTLLPCLLRLDIDLPESTLFTKYDIRHVSTICPMVEELKLCPLARFPIATGPPSITLEDLAPLMANCPRLHTLSVVVNAKHGTGEVLSSREASSASLLRLHVGHSWVGDTLHITILLSHLAPHLETLKWFHEKNRPGYVEANARGWERVAEALPHLQNVRLSERLFATHAIDRVESQVLQVEFAEKGIDATVATMECEVQVQPAVTETAVQFSPILVDRMVDAEPQMCSISIGAIPETVDSAIQALPRTVDQSVEAVVSTGESAVDATVPTFSRSVEALVEESASIDKTPSVRSSSVRSSLASIHLSDVVSMAWKLVVFFPLTVPSRIIHMALERARLRKEAQKKEGTVASSSTNIPLNTIQVRS